MIEVRNLHKSFGKVKAVNGMTFEARDGEITGLLGPNGAGKTTTLRSICGMVRTEGSVVMAGAEIRSKATEDIVRTGIAHVPEGRGTFTRVTTEENLLLGAYTRGKDSGVQDDIDRVYSYFPRLKERRNQQAGTLSGGEQQMLSIARALARQIKVLLLDEPYEGLAPVIIDEIEKTCVLSSKRV